MNEAEQSADYSGASIAFIVPVLNGEKFIQRCLESIISEAEETDEIIVVDNGSTDNTPSIVKSFEQISLLVHPGVSVSALRNRAVSTASSTLLAFVDADCLLTEGWREKAIATISEEGVDATGSLYDLPDDARWIEKAWFTQKVTEKGPVKYINSGNLIVKRPVFEDLDGFDESLRSDEDCDFGERLNARGYRMIEDPDVRAIHLGNPRSLKDFYKKEAWHATSVLQNKSSGWLNKPTIMSLLFGLCLLVSLLSVLVSFLTGLNLYWVALSILFAPLLTGIVRGLQFSSIHYIPQLTLLWGIFYLARVVNMVDYFLIKPLTQRR